MLHYSLPDVLHLVFAIARYALPGAVRDVVAELCRQMHALSKCRHFRLQAGAGVQFTVVVSCGEMHRTG